MIEIWGFASATDSEAKDSLQLMIPQFRLLRACESVLNDGDLSEMHEIVMAPLHLFCRTVGDVCGVNCEVELSAPLLATAPPVIN